MRRSTLGSERYPFIIWWVCTIDLYALFSGAGSGEFVGAMVKGNMLPGPDTLLYPTSPTGYSVIYPEENDSLPMILQMHHDTFVLAIRLGFLAADLRREAMSSRFLAGSVGPAPFAHPTSRLKKLLELRNSLRLLWESPNAIWLRQNMSSFPPRSVELWQQVSDSSFICDQTHHRDWLTIFAPVYISLPCLRPLLLYQHVAGPASGTGRFSRRRAYAPLGGYTTSCGEHNPSWAVGSSFYNISSLYGRGVYTVWQPKDDGTGLHIEHGEGRRWAQCDDDTAYPPDRIRTPDATIDRYGAFFPSLLGRYHD